MLLTRVPLSLARITRTHLSTNCCEAAYVMMACPVLESHHDIAALNSNLLMKK